MSRLEEAGYIEVEKEFIGKKPNTKLSLTETGRNAFIEYRENIVNIVSN
jgi:DNA-binding PadR family transcriptional regulator